MDQDELIRRFHTPDSDLTLAARQRIDELTTEMDHKRARGEVVAESLAQRHADDIPQPTPTRKRTDHQHS